jgi:hypothetical protein
MLSLKSVINCCGYSIEIRQITTNQHQTINAEVKYAQPQHCAVTVCQQYSPVMNLKPAG